MSTIQIITIEKNHTSYKLLRKQVRSMEAARCAIAAAGEQLRIASVAITGQVEKDYPVESAGAAVHVREQGDKLELLIQPRPQPQGHIPTSPPLGATGDPRQKEKN